jgi:exodeoxyribonuclease V alpha subunit
MKELIYTGLTRSKRALVLFLQKAKGKGPLQLARERSAILTRNTSIFERPEDIKSKLWPDKNVPVKSKIEYILYKYLNEAQKEKRLEFKYERSLLFKNKGLTIHPDFTIQIGGKQYFWEHLGELDLKRYALNWGERRKDYEIDGLADCLVTTDDLEGVKEEKILPVIDDLVRGKLKETTANKFSKHHYQLY